MNINIQNTFGDYPLEIAARACARMNVIGVYPDSNTGRAKEQTYVNEHWASIWIWNRIRSNSESLWLPILKNTL